MKSKDYKPKRFAGCLDSQMILLFFFLFNINSAYSQQDSVLNNKIDLNPQKCSIYEALSQITDKTGFFFIYDSKFIDSDKTIEVSGGKKPLLEYLKEIVDNKSLKFKVIEKHILVYKAEEKKNPVTTVRIDSAKYLLVRGTVIDRQSKKPLSFVTIGLLEDNIGAISNFDGFFSLKLPSSYINSTLVISHLGYKTQKIPVRVLLEQKMDILLETEYVSIQEVIIRNIDSRDVIKKVYQNRQSNYFQQPIYLTSFYREGVIKDSKYLNYSEAVLKIYKSPYTRPFESDQIKLLKSRKVINTDQKDTVVLKLKGGLNSCLALDLFKNIPDFIDPEFSDNYDFTKVDIVSIDSRNAYAIAFEQKDNVSEALYKGVLYIDMESFALVNADFEINPKYVKGTDYLFVVKKSRKIKVTPEKIAYSISYNRWNGRYYMSHIRGDLVINYKKKYHIFSNDFHAFLELASNQIDTANVKKFPREEILKTNTVFLDTRFVLDETYWDDYNIIVPEEKLSQALSRINAKMELVKPE